MNKALIGLLGGSCCVFVIFFIVFMATSFSKVEQGEWCLKYNWWSESVDRTAKTQPGVIMVGMGNSLIRFPSVQKYVYFRKFDGTMTRTKGDAFEPPIACRTKDGLTVQLELEFTYKLLAPNLYDLYMLTGPSGYIMPLVHVSNGVIDNLATTFTAREFYGNRTLVATQFKDALAQTLRTDLFIELQNLMLQPAHFPKNYSSSISKTQAQRQDIEVAEQEKKTIVIQKQTQLQQATELAKRSVIQAEGEAQKVTLDNAASVAQFRYRQQKEAEGYAQAMAYFTQSNAGTAIEDFLNYLKVKALKEHDANKTAVSLTPLV